MRLSQSLIDGNRLKRGRFRFRADLAGGPFERQTEHTICMGEPHVGWRIQGIFLDRPLEVADSGLDTRLSHLKKMKSPFEIEFMRLRTCYRASPVSARPA